MMSYTPGPWVVREYDKPVITSDGDHYPIAEIDDELKEASANARLIAKAPEMAELLEGLTKQGALPMYVDRLIKLDELREDARTLLSQIKGDPE